MKIGIFSGSFDPIHTGHAMVANYVSQNGDLDEVWLMVSRLNPLKCGSIPAPDSDRLKMASIVAQGCDNVKVSDFELGLPLPSYTYSTLCSLRSLYPEDDFYLIIGSDNWVEFKRWKNWENIISEFKIIIYPRSGFPLSGDLPANVSVLQGCPQALISSTFIREGIKQKMNLNFFLPQEVFNYIKKNGLYQIGYHDR